MRHEHVRLVPAADRPRAASVSLALSPRLRPPRLGISIPVFEAELAAFAQAVGAGPKKQIVLVLDQAGWHTSGHLRVPDHVHLLFLPAHSPELQPAEHLWPLTNDALINAHFANLDALDEAQFACCAALQHQLDRIRSATLFPWWPKRIKKRQGPRRN